MLLAVDLTRLPKGIRDNIHRVCTDDNAMAAMHAKVRQQQIAKFYHDNTPRSMDGIGGQVMAMDPYWLNYFRWQLGTEAVQQDSDIKKWILKRHPEFRVRSGGTRIQVGFGDCGAGASRRYTKRYPSERPDNRKSK
jgi:hypothetical protein